MYRYKSYAIGLVASLGIATMLSGCSKEEAPVPEPESRPAKLMPVSVGVKESTRQFPAIVQAGDKAVLTFRVPGQLQNVFVFSGDIVKRGDVLAELNPDEYTLLEREAQAQFELANVQYTRMKKLRKDRVVSEQDYDQALANFNSKKASLSQATANLGYTKLIAPYDGTISYINSENFEFVAASQAVMNIQSTTTLKVTFQLPDHLLQRISSSRAGGNEVPGNLAEVVFDAFPEKSYPLTFFEIDTEADAKTASYKVTMILDMPEDAGVLPGMSGQVTVYFPQTSATRIPDSAVINDSGSEYVWRINDESLAEKVAVTLDEGGRIVSGLDDGDKIIVSGVSGTEEGMKIREWIKEGGL
ncbi:efflux RND transporter periplasmic adaptor subunit [Vibrio hannami]|uniref:efflux RND transporter periplasmic adaptor subunit n=1 Tax=Vibrio hannami TaxID=2717094 RepID=UPI0024109C02|nr:efflux RND transporter periplasmic adaptor subunit [Vibrio hannami]MDG3086339.1 efflux RND transporter periplasmic adaptor subunit [Vibrio hannami]